MNDDIVFLRMEIRELRQQLDELKATMLEKFDSVFVHVDGLAHQTKNQYDEIASLMSRQQRIEDTMNRS